MTKTLVALMHVHRAGTVVQDHTGVLTLTYESSYRSSPAAIPISLSMPLARPASSGTVVRGFCQGLLPDNEAVLERWGRDFRVFPGNPFALLTHVGEDCAGAVQFVTPDRVEGLLAQQGAVVPLTEKAVAERLRTLQRDPSSWHLAGTGQFSLAGAQAKTALHFDPGTGRWGDPSGSVPTTHILKPAITGFAEHDLNEHLCLCAARILGLRSAESRVLRFGGERAIVVDRYDRLPAGGGRVQRIHQEDMCQALGLPPSTKYQSEGGPSAEQIIALLRSAVRPSSVAEREVGRFVDALVFNWLIAGTDAHAKNYSVLLTANQVRLAPLYDVASSLPCEDMYLPRLRLAMKVGSEYRISAITGRHWRAFAVGNRLDADRLLVRIDEIARRLPAAFREVAAADAVAALRSDLPERLAKKIEEHAGQCRARLAAS